MSTSLNVKRLEYRLQQNGLALPKQVTKRDGAVVTFDLARIERAVRGCYGDLPADAQPAVPAAIVAETVGRSLAAAYALIRPTVEQVQDLVEVTLTGLGEFDAARAYMTYRDEHTALRGSHVPDDVVAAFSSDARYFPTPLQQFQFYDKYARFDWDAMRRETYIETVDRVVEHLRWLVFQSHGGTLPDGVFARIRGAMLRLDAMPSMRALAMAGEPARRNGLSIYNCSYMPVDSIDSFVEALLLSMAGCGVGFSVERQHVDQLPRVQRQDRRYKPLPHIIEDSTEGWAAAVRFGMESWFGGREVEFVYDGIRPAGTPLRVKGGRASGPEPLRTALVFLREKVLARQGAVLSTLDAHDMMCAIGSAAVAGGVRRTAMISLFDWDDDLMRTCKDGDQLDNNPVRWNANNSAVWPDELSQLDVIQQMSRMAESGRGEPGIFSRANARRTRPERRADAEFGTNPCGEINLRPRGLCNLSIAVARPGDTEADLCDKVEVATIIGTIQSLTTNFPEMRPQWSANCREERLLGVDLLGQRDCEFLRENDAAGSTLRGRLKAHAIRVNAEYAAMLDIAPAAAITCDKPAGNSSMLLNTASGIHTRWAPYYLRRTRVAATSALYRVLRDAGVPLTPENGQDAATATTWVAAWPVAAPEGARTRKDFTAVEQCEFWLLNKTSWTEHNPSVTITYQSDEVIDLMAWVWSNRDLIGGMAFLPADDAEYDQAPYEEISRKQYEAAVEAFPGTIDYSALYLYEHSDMTTAAQELACMSGSCET